MSQLWRIARTFVRLLLRRPLPGTSIVPVLDDGRVVLVQRRDSQRWALPGGLVDWGEDIRAAAQRELKEETGLEMTDTAQLVGVYSSRDRDPRMHSICIAVTARVQGEFQISDTAEIMAVRAFSRQDIPLESLAHDHTQQLSDYFSGIVGLS
ncbi:MAG: NUDIX hydrolase [Synechococcus sp.]